MVLLNLIFASVFVVVSVTGNGYHYKYKPENEYGDRWLDIGGYCQTEYGRQGTYLSIEQCPSAQELQKRGIFPEIYYFIGLPAMVCCEQSDNLPSQFEKYGEISTQKDHVPYESSEEDCNEDHPFPFIVDQDDYYQPYHHYRQDTKFTASSYHGYHPDQKLRPEYYYYYFPNGGHGNQKPSTQRPIVQTTVAVKNPFFTFPPTQSPNSPSYQTVNDRNSQNSNGIPNKSNIPTQQQNNPFINVRGPPKPVTPSTGIAVQKCREYFRAVPLSRPRHIPIIGGRPANPKQFPYVVLLGYGSRDNKMWACGGTLISDQFVMTAAHCLKSLFLGTVKFVRLGEFDLSTTHDDADVKDFDVIEIFQHPMYNITAKYNDIGLLRFKGSVEFTPYIRPACLSMTKNLENIVMTAAGWGVTDDGIPASVLQRVTLLHVSNEKCRAIYNKNQIIQNGVDEDIQVCADGGGTERRDTCKGDSGGPLQYANYDFDESNGGVIEIVGITSYGKGCGLTPGVYTRVLPYVPWIESIVWR